MLRQRVDRQIATGLDGTLRRLLDRSLVVRETSSPPGFRLLETVKLYVRDQGDGDTLIKALDAHASWCLSVVGEDASRSVFDYGLGNWCASHYYDLNSAGRHLSFNGRSDEASTLLTGTAFATHCDAGPRAAETLARVDVALGQTDDDALTARLRFVGVMCGMATRAPEVITEQGRFGLGAAERTDDRVLLSIARVLRSWSMVFTDVDAAIDLTKRAAADAPDVGDGSALDFADSYRAFTLALDRRYDEATDLAPSVMERNVGESVSSYPVLVAIAAFTSIGYLADPEATIAWSVELRGAPSPEHSMWASDLVAAALHASAIEVATCRAICIELHERLTKAGHTAFPDLLIPIAALAHRLGEDELAMCWMTAVHDADVPTQSFQATVLYRRLREELETSAQQSHVGEAAPAGSELKLILAEIGLQALAWLEER